MRYCDIADTPAYNTDDMDTTLTKIREKLVAGVDKRLDADTPVGFLLSGGLDSSLVCAIAAKKLGKPIRTFAIGMSEDNCLAVGAGGALGAVCRYGMSLLPVLQRGAFPLPTLLTNLLGAILIYCGCSQKSIPYGI